MAVNDNSNFTDFNLSNTGYAAFDATSLKRLIIDRLNENKVFTDQNFEGSNLSSIIDIVGYSYHVLLFYLNQTSTESLFSEAQLYENMNRIVKSIDYRPVGFQTSNMSVNMKCNSNITTDTYVIPRYSFIKSGATQFTTKEDIVFTKTVDGEETITTVGNKHLLYQGLWKEYPHQASIGEKFETITLLPGENVKIDHFNIHVYVKDIYTKKWTEWSRTDSLFLKESDTEGYEVRFNENKHYELKFGNNITGKQLNTGDIVAIYYLETDPAGKVGGNAVDGNTITFFNNVGFLNIFNEVKDQNSLYITEAQAKNLSWSNPYASSDFYMGESIEDIRTNAPKTYTSQYRLINADDYKTHIKNKFSNIIRDVEVINNTDYVDEYIAYMYNDLQLRWPNQDANTLYNQVLFASSCDFNNIYIFAVPRTEKSNSYTVKNNYLTPAQKTAVLDSLRDNKVLTAEPVIVDPIYEAIDIGLAYSNEKITHALADNTKIRLTRSKTSRVSVDNMRQSASELIKNYFKTSELGATINFANLTNSIANLAGVKYIHTVRTDVDNLEVEGVSFIYYNPVYPHVNVQMSSSIIVLPRFKYAYLNNADDFINKIEVVTEDISVY